MVSPDYDQFFAAAATVAGALIGLLFVALSVRPSAAAASAPITTRLRAAAALSALLNTLLLSLLALRPHPDIGDVAITLGAIGLAAMLTLLLLLTTDRRETLWSRTQGAPLLLGQAVVYLLQILDGVHLIEQPGNTSKIDSLTFLIVLLFAFGVGQAWDLAGADSPSLIKVVVTTIIGRRLATDPRINDAPTSDANEK